MRGKTSVTILGLLLVQALAAILMGMLTSARPVIEHVVAFVFILAAAVYLNGVATRARNAPFTALLAFAFGFLHIVYLSFFVVSLWLVLMLCMDAAGFILSLDQLGDRPRPRQRKRQKKVYARKAILEKELPPREPVKVTVYDQELGEQPKKRLSKRKKSPAPKAPAKKSAQKKRLKKR